MNKHDNPYEAPQVTQLVVPSTRFLDKVSAATLLFMLWPCVITIWSELDTILQSNFHPTKLKILYLTLLIVIGLGLQLLYVVGFAKIIELFLRNELWKPLFSVLVR